MARPALVMPIQALLSGDCGERLSRNEALCTGAASSCGGAEQRENSCVGLSGCPSSNPGPRCPPLAFASRCKPLEPSPCVQPSWRGPGAVPWRRCCLPGDGLAPLRWQSTPRGVCWAAGGRGSLGTGYLPCGSICVLTPCKTGSCCCDRHSVTTGAGKAAGRRTVDWGQPARKPEGGCRPGTCFMPGWAGARRVHRERGARVKGTHRHQGALCVTVVTTAITPPASFQH